MQLMPSNNDSGLESDLSLISSISNKSSFTEEVYSNYNTHDSFDNDSEICVKKGFSIHTNDKSYETTLAECMTKEN